MAEILLSLTIIGVVAAITLPSLTGNINERTWNTQRKALYARFSQAMPLINSLNGYADAETFVSGAMGKVLKINNVCDKDHLSDCGLATSYVNLAGTKEAFPKTMAELNPALTSVNYCDSGGNALYYWQLDDSDAAAFETANGESIAIYYNPKCKADMQETGRIYAQSKICAHFVYDLNGSKGPNTIGKDMGFITAIYPIDSVVVSPIPHYQDASSAVIYDDASKACTQQDSEYRVPSVYELMSMFASAKMIGGTFGANKYQPSTLVSTGNELMAYRFAVESGSFDMTQKNLFAYALRCVKR